MTNAEHSLSLLGIAFRLLPKSSSIQEASNHIGWMMESFVSIANGGQ